MIVLYHLTNPAAARQILRSGLHDTEGYYGTTNLRQGVWLSDQPLRWQDIGLSPDAITLLEVSLDLEADAITSYEFREEHNSYRAWQVPADLINRHGTLKIIAEDVDDLSEVITHALDDYWARYPTMTYEVIKKALRQAISDYDERHRQSQEEIKQGMI
jgi:hypothetical protein